MHALTRPLPANPTLGIGLLVFAALLPLIAAAWPALLASALSTGIGLRSMGRLKWSRRSLDPVSNLCALALFAWCAGLFYFATGGPS
jgi:hypothetical protein